MPDRRSKRSDVIRLVLVLVAFCVATAAWGASKLQSSSGGTWLHAFLVGVPVILAMATPVAIIVIVSLRDRGDRMPTELWSGWTTPPDPSAENYTMSRGYRIATVGFFVCMLISAPFFIVAAIRAGPGATIFVGCWTVLLVLGVRSWRRSPSDLTLVAEELRVRSPDGGEKHVPISAVSEIRWSYWSGYVRIVYNGGTLDLPRQIRRLDDLVIELRRRNPSIRFDGRWPPANLR